MGLEAAKTDLQTFAAKRLIVALDFPQAAPALALAERLEGVASFFKVGYELYVAEGPSLLERLVARGARVFLDLKMNDVPETIRRATHRVAQFEGVAFLTIYGPRATVVAAAEGTAGTGLKILQVSLLTSMGAEDLEEEGILERFGSVEAYVQWRGAMSIAAGAHGLIASGQNVAMLREALGPEPTLVCPGIRPGNVGVDDHKRAATPAQAIGDGADYLVVGRPIRDAADPAASALGIIDEMADAFGRVV